MSGKNCATEQQVGQPHPIYPFSEYPKEGPLAQFWQIISEWLEQLFQERQ